MNDDGRGAVSDRAIAVDTQKIADFYQEAIAKHGDRLDNLIFVWSTDKTNWTAEV